MLVITGLGRRALALVTAIRVVVDGWSMYPTLAPGEYLLFDRLAYRGEAPRRGDVALASGVLGDGRSIIKRVAGVPGDVVLLDGGAITVNGVSPEGAPLLEDLSSHQSGEWRLGPDEYFLLGDAPEFSTDSRAFGPVPRSAIVARAWLVYRPVSRWRRLDAGSNP